MTQSPLDVPEILDRVAGYVLSAEVQRYLEPYDDLERYDDLKRLFVTLKLLSNSLRELVMYKLSGLQPGVLLPLPQSNIHYMLMAEYDATAGERLVLPFLETLSCIECSDATFTHEEIVLACPSLKKLVPGQLSNTRLTLAYNLRLHCPHLQTLTFHSDHPAKASNLIQHCSAAGLVSLEVFTAFSPEVVTAIQSHASTLEVLVFQYKSVYFEEENRYVNGHVQSSKTLLASLPMLKKLALNISVAEFACVLPGEMGTTRTLSNLEEFFVGEDSFNVSRSFQGNFPLEMTRVWSYRDWDCELLDALDSKYTGKREEHTTLRTIMRKVRGPNRLHTMRLNGDIFKRSSLPE
ncbi:hypothetical protein BGW39_002418 [Mortierella sp. 14UC]|nr:hypothetical protein BGW39_002418 [Mortierella sp. 14UC]